MIDNTVIVDTNLIFSALIPRASKIRDVLLDKQMAFFAPNFLLRTPNLLSVNYIYINGIIERVQFLPIDFLSKNSKQKAYDLCKDIDLKDTPFIALSIELDIPLWTGDKKLKEGLKLKGFNRFY